MRIVLINMSAHYRPRQAPRQESPRASYLRDFPAKKPGVLAQAPAPVALGQRRHVPGGHGAVQHHRRHADARLLDWGEPRGHNADGRAAGGAARTTASDMGTRKRREGGRTLASRRMAR